MKTLISFVFFLFFCQLNSQVKNIDIVDFYHWTANDGTYYEFIIVAEDDISIVRNPTIIRVKYSVDGGVTYKLAEFAATMRWNKDEKNTDNIIAYIDAAQTATLLKGSGGYTPDNFILYFNTKTEDFVKGYQADHNELAKDEIEYAKVFPTNYNTAEDLRKLIRIFYEETDPLYPRLIAYTAKFY